MNGAEDPAVSQSRPQGRAKPVSRHHGWQRVAGLVISVCFFLFLGFCVLAVLALSGKTIRLPVWAVAEVEARLNTTIRADAVPGTTMALSVGGVLIVVPDDWVPRFQLEDVRLRRPDGQTLVSLPEARIQVDPASFAKGQLRVKSLALVGPQMSIRRDAEGQFDLAVEGSDAPIADARSFAALLDAGDAVFASPALASLDRVDVEGLSLTMTDARAGRRWELGDGRLVIERRADALAGELSVTLIEGGRAPALATIGIVTALGDSSAKLTATVTGMAAHDVAAIAPPLAFLAVLDAPISGRIAGEFDAQGSLAALEGELDVSAGALRPEGSVAPLTFEKAGIALVYDPSTAGVVLRRLQVESRSVKLNAAGNIYLRGADGRAIASGVLPEAILGQLSFDDVQVDPEGLFAAPVRFSSGALDIRLTLNPFAVEIGQLALEEGGEHLLLSGSFGADAKGWTSEIDVALDRIRHDRLLKLWPLRLVPKTRSWLAENVQAGDLFDVNAALRTAPGKEPTFSLGYEFAAIDVRFLRSLPPIKEGYGRASIEGQRYVMALDRGYVMAPTGGKVVVDRSVFEVPDISVRPTRANITLVSSASLTATLSMLDQPPFLFATKAGQPVAIGQGHADVVTKLSLPLVPKVQVADVTYSATGKISDLVSTVVVPGRTLTAKALDLDVTRQGLRLTGPGNLDGVGFDVAFIQGFGPEAKGKSRVEGRVELTDAGLRSFGVNLPEGTLQGTSEANLTLDLEKGAPGQLRITSDLKGMSVSVPPLGWRKGPEAGANLALEMLLGPNPEVTSLKIVAAGLTAEAAITLRAGGGLDVARFSTLQVGDWLDATADVTGQDAGRAALIALTGGTLDLRQLPEQGRGSGDGQPVSLRLDRVIVTRGIVLTDFRGETTNRGGMSGDFVASVNGGGRLQGTVVPQNDGTAIRIRSKNAGEILAAAGIFASGRGGALELVLRSRGVAGAYDGTTNISKMRVVDAPVLAELLNAVSVIGILEQLNGDGLLFSNVDLDFRMETGAVQIKRGAAIGASMGVSFAGLYDSETEALNLQGVVSPFYLLNGVGAIFTRRGEGIFGFNYRLKGNARDPQVSVNPLSILTPAMFRDIFRSGPPTLKDRKE